MYLSYFAATNQPKLKAHWDKKPKKRDGKAYQKWTTHFRNRVICKLKTDPKLLRKLHTAMTHLSVSHNTHIQKCIDRPRLFLKA